MFNGLLGGGVINQHHSAIMAQMEAQREAERNIRLEHEISKQNENISKEPKLELDDGNTIDVGYTEVTEN